MKKFLLSLCFFAVAYAGKAQPIEYFYGSSMYFSYNGIDSLKYPFIGGIVAPQFSEIDMNGDGIKDMFVFDRSGNKILCFLNEGKTGQVSYKYAPQYEALFPPLFSWVLLRDYNCDGKEDIFTNTEANGYAVYKNTTTNGNVSFQHIVTDLLDSTQVNMYCMSMDIPVIDDVDGDGDLDIMSFGVLGGNAEFYRNQRVEYNLPCDSLMFKFVDFCWGSFTEGGFNSDIFLGHTCTKYYRQKSSRHAGSSLLTLDTDGDGDKELLLGDVDAPSLKLLVNGKVETSWPWDTVTSVIPHYPNTTLATFINKFPAGYYVDINNDGKKDLITASNEAVAGSNLNQIWWYKNNGLNNNPNFQFIDSSLFQDLTVDFGAQSAPVFFDTDGDGDEDLLIINRGSWRETKGGADRIALFENKGTATAPKFVLKTQDYLGFASQNITGLHVTFGDLNNDGKKEMILGRQNGKLSYYSNTGTTTAPAFTLVDSTYAGIDVGSFSTPFLYDVDGDNARDLLIGSSFGTIKYFRNNGTPGSASFNSSATEDSVGHILTNSFFYSPVFDSAFNIVDSTRTFEYEGYSTVYVANLDQDTIPEMITGGRNGWVRIFEMKPQAMSDSFPEITDYLREPKTGVKHVLDAGARSACAAHDLDGDGIAEIFVGNSRGGLQLLSSTYQTLDSIVTAVKAVTPSIEAIVYPNPANQGFDLVVDSRFYGQVEMELVDVLGKTHWVGNMDLNTESKKAISTASLNPGVYFITLRSDNFGSQTIRVLVVR